VISYETVDVEGRKGIVSLSFSSAGAVRVKGIFEYGVNSRGQPLKITMTGSAVLCALGGTDYCVFVYLPPRVGKFAGLVDTLRLSWDEASQKIF